MLEAVSDDNAKNGLPSFTVDVEGMETSRYHAHSTKDACRMMLVRLDCDLKVIFALIYTLG